MERDRALREQLVETLERHGVLRDAAVKSAVLSVPRHRFIPDVRLEDAYDDRALATMERDGFVISSISQPAMIVQMLQLLQVAPGQTVLEIGTGTGYNAALLATLTGPAGRVVTVDIEPDLVEAAESRFAALGFTSVLSRHASELATLQPPFDRIIATARTEDFDPQWWRLLADGGRIVVPLDVGYGGERAVGFVREGRLVRSYGSYPCAFLEMRGTPPERETEVFFPNRRVRYAAPPAATVPMSIVGAQRADATEALLENADVVVARPNTVFSLQLS